MNKKQTSAKVRTRPSSVKMKKPTAFDFDLICIGSGAAGCRAASLAAKLGKRVAIVEASNILGGECPNFSCVPTKALLQTTKVFKQVRRSSIYGVVNQNVRLDYSRAQQYKNQAVNNTGSYNAAQTLTEIGVTVLRGQAEFVNPWVLGVSGRHWRAKDILIATGAKDHIPAIEGLNQVDYLTFKTATSLTKPPGSIFIIGGGASGCEFAEFFKTIGSRVQLAEINQQLLDTEDIEIGQVVNKLLGNQGVIVHLTTQVIKVDQKKDGKKIVWFEKDGKKQRTIVDQILIATGKRPSITDLKLENATVKHDPQLGIKVNRYLQTNTGHIWAAGDVIGPWRFTHMALYQANLVIKNIYRRRKAALNYRAVPRCIFLNPEVAAVGVNEKELRQQSSKYGQSIVAINQVSRSNTSGHKTGFVKILTNHNGVLVGGSIVAPSAGEMIHQLALAINARLSVVDITRTIHAFPTWSEAIWLACRQITDQ